jgi:hypothetical protein
MEPRDWMREAQRVDSNSAVFTVAGYHGHRMNDAHFDWQ